MTGQTRTAALADPMVSGPRGPGRPVSVEGRVIGIAESWDEVDAILERAGLPEDADVEWVGGDAMAWE